MFKKIFILIGTLFLLTYTSCGKNLVDAIEEDWSWKDANYVMIDIINTRGSVDIQPKNVRNFFYFGGGATVLEMILKNPEKNSEEIYQMEEITKYRKKYNVPKYKIMEIINIYRNPHNIAKMKKIFK